MPTATVESLPVSGPDSTPLSYGGPRLRPAELWVPLAYIVLAALLTYPLMLDFADHIPEALGDQPAYLWNIWWVQQAVKSPELSVFYSPYLFYPVGADMRMHDLGLGLDFLGLPWVGVVPLIGIYNAILFLS